MPLGGTPVHHSEILDAMKTRRDALDTAIAALTGDQAPKRSYRRRHMSPTARARISKMMKLRWAERKKKSAGKAA